MAAPKKFRDDKASSGRVLAIAMPTWQPGRFPYYSPLQPNLRFSTPFAKSKKMGISRNLNRALSVLKLRSADTFYSVF
jgi:hypothetical protein